MIRALLHTAIVLISSSFLFLFGLFDYLATGCTLTKDHPPFHWFVASITISPSPYYHHALTIWHYLALNFSLEWFESWVVRKTWQSNIWDHFDEKTLPGHLWENFLGIFSQTQTLFHTGCSSMCCALEKVSDVTTQGPVAGSVQVYNIRGGGAGGGGGGQGLKPVWSFSWKVLR